MDEYQCSKVQPDTYRQTRDTDWTRALSQILTGRVAPGQKLGKPPTVEITKRIACLEQSSFLVGWI